MNAKSDQVYKLVKGMKDRNVPIDGVGLQFHWNLGQHGSLASVAQNMARLAALGLEIHITEREQLAPSLTAMRPRCAPWAFCLFGPGAPVQSAVTPGFSTATGMPAGNESQLRGAQSTSNAHPRAQASRARRNC
jgi:hypothetical protein